MNLELGQIGLSGRYRMVVSKDKELKDITHDTGEFDNLITNVGMNRWGDVQYAGASSVDYFRSICGRFVVGSGLREPAFTDTALQSPVNHFPSTNVTLHQESSSRSRGYYEITVQQQFPKGAVKGNLSEIGIQHTSLSGPLWSRALILDMEGNPTTVTVLENDFLTCYYTLRVMIPQEDSVFNISVDYGQDGGIIPTTVTARPLTTESSSTTEGWGLCNGILTLWAYFQFYTGGLAAPTATKPLGSTIGNRTNTFTLVPYVTDSHQLFFTRTDELDDHLGQELRTAQLAAMMGLWQLEFDPPLKKDSTQTMTFTFGYSWARA